MVLYNQGRRDKMAKKKKQKNKVNKDLIVGSLIDFIIGLILILIAKMID